MKAPRFKNWFAKLSALNQGSHGTKRVAFPAISIAFWWRATGMAAPSMQSLAVAH